MLLQWALAYENLLEHLLSITLGKYLEVELLCHMLIWGFSFLRTHKLQLQLHDSTFSNTQGFRFSHKLANMSCYSILKIIIGILVAVKWHLLVVLICVTFMCYWPFVWPSLEECLFKFSAHFKIGSLIFSPILQIALPLLLKYIFASRQLFFLSLHYRYSSLPILWALEEFSSLASSNGQHYPLNARPARSGWALRPPGVSLTCDMPTSC